MESIPKRKLTQYEMERFISMGPGTALFWAEWVELAKAILEKQGNKRTNEIKTLMKRTAQDIIEIGEKLIEVKERLPHGAFGQWLDSEFEWRERTARNFMQVAEKFKSVNFADLNFAPSALYLLVAPSTFGAARAEALRRAEAGQKITHKKAKSIIEENHTPPPKYTCPDCGQVLPSDEPYPKFRKEKVEQ